MTDIRLCLLVLLLSNVGVIILALRLFSHLTAEYGKDRSSWTKERAALLERAAPGVVLTERPEPEPQRQGDAYEWRVERERQGLSAEVEA